MLTADDASMGSENVDLRMVVVDVNNLKDGRKPVKLQKDCPAGCAGEGRQSKENIGNEKIPGISVTRIRCEER